jgi:hypothetical protein
MKNLVTPLYIDAPLEKPLLFLQTNKKILSIIISLNTSIIDNFLQHNNETKDILWSLRKNLFNEKRKENNNLVLRKKNRNNLVPT